MLERSVWSSNGVRSPRTYGSQTGTRPGVPSRGSSCSRWGPGRGVPAQQLAGPVHEEGAGVARAPDEILVRRRAGVADQPVDGEPLVTDHPADQGGPEDHQDVALVDGARHDLVAEGVDGPTRDDGFAVRQRAGGLAHGHDHRHLLLGDAQAAQELGVPALVGVQHPQRRRHAGVDRRQAGNGVGRHGLAGPVAAGVGRLGGGPAEEPLGVGHGAQREDGILVGVLAGRPSRSP